MNLLIRIRKFFDTRNILLVVFTLVLAGLVIYIGGLRARLGVLEFLASHTTGCQSAFADPGDDAWYTVENDRFGIDSTGGSARATTDGINAALEWAKGQGYAYVRFPEGTYMIQCNWQDRFSAPTDGILVPSGLTLDLGDATFMMEPNSYPEYCIFGIVNQSDVTIVGGTLIGDLGQHVYAPSALSPTHEFGFGICVSASRNVLIQNVAIKNMTGDGIILEGSYASLADGGMISSKVRILGCDISNCRRQGISVIGAPDSEIAGNRIYDIKGTNPQFGIDVEPEFDYIVDNLVIRRNVIAGCAGGAVSCHSGSNYQVYDNACQGNILAVFSTGVKIYDNTVDGSVIQVYQQASSVEVYDNRLEGNSRVVIE